MHRDDNVVEQDKENRTELINKLVYATEETSPRVPGRRTFFNYRDLGLTLGTEGKARAQIMSATGVMEETGWHYHICEAQFAYVLRGWIDLQFEDGRLIRVSEGESLSVPPGLKHNEVGISEDLEILEVSVPAKMKTVPCDPPEHLLAR